LAVCLPVFQLSAQSIIKQIATTAATGSGAGAGAIANAYINTLTE